MRKQKRVKPSKYKFMLPLITGAIIGLFCSTMIFCAMIASFIAVDGHNYYDEYLQNSIDSIVVKDLCSKNIVPDSIIDCSQPDLMMKYYQVREVMEYYLKQGVTYSEINTLFGDYERDCYYKLPESNINRCSYQFDEYKLRLVFNVNTDEFVNIGG